MVCTPGASWPPSHHHSTVAPSIHFQIADGVTKSVPCSYIEFAERLVLPQYSNLPLDEVKEHHRRDRFENDLSKKKRNTKQNLSWIFRPLCPPASAASAASSPLSILRQAVPSRPPQKKNAERKIRDPKTFSKIAMTSFQIHAPCCLQHSVTKKRRRSSASSTLVSTAGCYGLGFRTSCRTSISPSQSPFPSKFDLAITPSMASSFFFPAGLSLLPISLAFMQRATLPSAASGVTGVQWLWLVVVLSDSATSVRWLYTRWLRSVAVLSKGSGGASSSTLPPWLLPLNEIDKNKVCQYTPKGLLRLLPRSCQTTSKTAVKRLAGREALPQTPALRPSSSAPCKFL
ncbi:hypothetical protein ACFX11_040622 [Malus domestica]